MAAGAPDAGRSSRGDGLSRGAEPSRGAGSSRGAEPSRGAGSSRFALFWEALDAVPVAADAEAVFDPSTAEGALRRTNLSRYLDHVGPTADTLLVAEAPGWRGMTNTGIPFTSMQELGSLGFDVLVPPDPTAPWEASSRVVQAALAEWVGPLPLTWAIFPHHPFVAGDRLTNRTPRPAEVRAGAPVALALLDALGGSGVRVVAVGRKAQGALALAGIEADAVRHPAQGGARQFTEELRALNGR